MNFLHPKNFSSNDIDKNAFGNLWWWTSSNYIPYKNFRPFKGILGEYNEKFMFPRKMKLEKFNDRRFKIIKYLDILKQFTHSQQINLMLLNNVAQKKYLRSEIKYTDIVDYIMTNLKKLNFNSKFNSFNDTIRYINFIEKNHDK